MLCGRIKEAKARHVAKVAAVPAGKCGVDPLALVAALRCGLPANAMLFTDVTVSEHLATESFTACQPRTFFNPADNQAMGWSIPAAIGAQQVNSGRVVATLTGDGCFIMGMQELATAARVGLPVKAFVLDDHAFHYMQMLQEPAFRRTTATYLPALDYGALAKGFGVGYVDIAAHDQLQAGIQAALAHPGPVLVRVQTDYGNRKIRWVEAVRAKFTKELTPAQKARFLARVGARTVTGAKRTSD
jgi:acetolactate synthase-1/2/3 large subunit